MLSIFSEASPPKSLSHPFSMEMPAVKLTIFPKVELSDTPSCFEISLLLSFLLS
ncbi:MAG: hypothetical protein IPL26_23730 [Leptospiraceae bacterium]|nr:hypothetical protein [Leptospiraceae bacterium]